MKRKLCILLLIVALFLIGIFSLFACPPPQSTAGAASTMQTTMRVNVYHYISGGGILTIFDDGLFERGRIT
jgi:hypothetical protein